VLRGTQDQINSVEHGNIQVCERYVCDNEELPRVNSGQILMRGSIITNQNV